jgi:TIR domain/Pentapeptide repeats (8 copies)
MANQEHVVLLKQGAKAWNQWRQACPEIQPDLSEARLKDALLSEIDFRGVNLHRANLSEATLTRANLREADLSEADLKVANLGEAYLDKANLVGAYLSGAYLGGASLIETNLSRTNLRGTNFFGANLSEANLQEAYLRATNLTRTRLDGVNFIHSSTLFTIFGDVDLRHTKGLEMVKHLGPSTIGIDTIYRSQGMILETFLRGTGIPESFLALALSLVSSSNNFYSCFISYSSQDQVFAEKLYSDLQSNGVRCWFAPEDLKIGDKIRPRIDESIHFYDKLLLILSQHSMISQWVEQEVETALEKERKEQRTVLFPIRLDNAVMEIEGGWPGLIRNTRNIGDFTCLHRHEVYQKALDRLLRDLKAEALKPKV